MSGHGNLAASSISQGKKGVKKKGKLEAADRLQSDSDTSKGFCVQHA